MAIGKNISKCETKKYQPEIEKLQRGKNKKNCENWGEKQKRGKVTHMLWLTAAWRKILLQLESQVKGAPSAGVIHNSEQARTF